MPRLLNFDMAAPDCAGLPKRSFRFHGIEFTVCEFPPSLRGPALVFYAPGIARRVTRYPANWQHLSDEDLYAVSWER